MTARWQASIPKCDGCSAPLQLVEPGSEGRAICAACGSWLETFPAPLWVRTELPTAMQIYGAARDHEHGSGRSVNQFWLCFQGTPPALVQQREQAIESAIAPPPPPSSTVTVISSKKRRRWEYIGIFVGLLLMGAAVHRCGSRISEAPDEDVEPSQ